MPPEGPSRQAAEVEPSVWRASTARQACSLAGAATSAGGTTFAVPGWSQTGLASATELESGEVLILRQDGRQDLFLKTESGYQAPSGVTDTLAKPNGLCFSPDYQKLYIVDTGVTHNPDHPREITVWDVVDGQRLRHSRTFASMMFEGMQGMSDGIRADIAGNIWSAAGWGGEGFDGVHIFAPNGDRIGQIMLPESCSNLCFGGRKRNRTRRGVRAGDGWLCPQRAL